MWTRMGKDRKRWDTWRGVRRGARLARTGLPIHPGRERMENSWEVMSGSGDEGIGGTAATAVEEEGRLESKREALLMFRAGAV